MVRNLVVLAIGAGSLVLGACNMVRGAGQDLQSAANCTEELIKQNRC